MLVIVICFVVLVIARCLDHQEILNIKVSNNVHYLKNINYKVKIMHADFEIQKCPD